MLQSNYAVFVGGGGGLKTKHFKWSNFRENETKYH